MDITAIKSGFDASAQTYDQTRRQLIPCFDDFYQTAVALIPYQQEDLFRVLDLGAGTGLLASFVSERFPHARITLADLSEAMLEKAKERFSAAPENFEFVVADYSVEQIPGNFDVVISALSIHHLNNDLKQNLFAHIFNQLPSGGIFVNADQVLGATPEIDNFYRNTWMKQVIALGISDTELQAGLERMKEDKMAPLDIQLDWLRQAGFRLVNCWYKNFSFAVYSGQK